MLLGDYSFTPKLFGEKGDRALSKFNNTTFRKSSDREKIGQIYGALVALIQEEKEGFCLPACIEFLYKANELELTERKLSFYDFEFWFNHILGLTEEENYVLRSKIVGRRIPRDQYQTFFPVGLGTSYLGSHFVAAHHSPDVDTTIASLWGWVDAFSARVAQGQHIWSVPGGEPDSQVQDLLTRLFGKGALELLARPSMTVSLSAMDLLNQEGLVKKGREALFTDIHLDGLRSTILVDEEGFYLGEVHIEELETIRQVLVVFNTCMRWFENQLHIELITSFAKKDFSRDDIPSLFKKAFQASFSQAEPVSSFSDIQIQQLSRFLGQVLEFEKGIETTFLELATYLDQKGEDSLLKVSVQLKDLEASDLFDDKGKIKEDRSLIFSKIAALIQSLDRAIVFVRNYFEKLEIAIGIKRKVFSLSPNYVTLHAGVGEIKQKIQNHRFVTVVHIQEDGRLFPVGVIKNKDLSKQFLGTVSLRDFCNEDEIKMAPNLEIISVIDHHKSQLKTSSTPIAIIGDAQSSNTLVAEKAFELNDIFSAGGMALEKIESQLRDLNDQELTPKNARLIKRLLQKKLAFVEREESYLDPLREYLEYLCYLYAILDDTDLLNKVSRRDVLCLQGLLNRMKTLISGQEAETIDFDDLSKEKEFAKLAAKKLLHNEDMYSLYRQISVFREGSVEENIKCEAEGKSSNFFTDTKFQNGCCRVGQTKIYAQNVSTYLANRDKLIKQWIGRAKDFMKGQSEVDFHLHMVSTIPSADDVYHDKVGAYTHQDEIWLLPFETKLALDHLRSFLSSFQEAPEVINNSFSIEIFGPKWKDLEHILSRSFLSIKAQSKAEDIYGGSLIILKFNAGSINSRKSMITPYLPKLVN